MQCRCNLCGGEEFLEVKNRPVPTKCAQCGSLERTRLLWMYLQLLNLGKETRILHLAPERGLYRALSKIVSEENYHTADINPERYRRHAPRTRRLDLTDLEAQPSNAYDIIIHSHVLEHVPCNIAYVLFHLHRMLAEDGTHMFIIPFMPGSWDESFQELPADVQTRRFGQHDHVRRFGRDDRQSHLGKIIRLPEVFDATKDFTEEELRAANIPENKWHRFSGGTVLRLKKSDYLLQ